MSTERRYIYTNDLGIRKMIVIHPLENGQYKITLWALEDGTYCGSGEVTQEWLDNFIQHYSDIVKVA